MKPKTESKPAAAAPAASFAAFLTPGGPWMSVPAQVAETWQRQLNAGLRIMDAMLESAVKLRDAQTPAAGEFLARAAALQKAMLEARSPLEQWTVQCNWMIENATRGLALWQGLFDAASAANAELCACLQQEAKQAEGSAREIGQAAVNAPVGSLATQDLVKTALVSIDAAYGQMLKGSQQMMAAASEALNAGARLARPAAAKPAAKRGPA